MEANTNTDFYSPFEEHPKEDIEKVIKLAEEEQKRRIDDTAGETQRKVVAHQVSELFANGLRPTWFQRGSSFVLDLVGSVKKAGAAQLVNLNAKVQVAGQKGVAAAQELTDTISDAAGNAGLMYQDFTLRNIDRTIETAQGIKDKSLELAQGVKQDVSAKANETAQDIKPKIIETAQGIKTKSIETAQDAKGKVQEVAQKLKSAVINSSIYKKLNKSFSNLAETTNLAFTVMEEENERARRMNDSSESYAIVNAMNVARLIKALAPEFYCPSSEPGSFYHTRLLAEAERSRRVEEAKSDKAAIDNARAVASLVTAKFNAPVAPVAAPAKVEIVEEIKVTKPIPATM